jgi:serine/threonine-protein phosphatase PGAM5
MAKKLLILLRHGEYDTSPLGTPNLTARGREQARISGKALKGLSIDAAFCSTMIRAEETADVAAEELKIEFTRSKLLIEGMPTRIPSIPTTVSQVKADRARMDRAFEKFFQPSKKDRTELIVCHGNLIRYLLTRTLSLPASAWAKFVSNHCGITKVYVREHGMRVVSYNETVHLPFGLVT